mgnify:CR=1 FL=1
MPRVKHVCPRCESTQCVQVKEIVSGDGTTPSIVDTALVECVACGDVCHWTHWKTPEEHRRRAETVDRMVQNVAARRPVLDGEWTDGT